MKYLIISTLLFFSVQADDCSQDLFKYCKDQLSSLSVMNKCILTNKYKFTTACQKFLKEREEQTAKNDSCYQDYKNICSNASGYKQIQECMRNNFFNLTQSCKEMILSRKEKLDLIGKGCEDDYYLNCYTTPKGTDQSIRCLKELGTKLTASCQKALSI